MNNNLTFHQRIHNAAGSQAVENCHARHSFGRMRGFDSVWFNSVGTYDARTYINYLTLYRKFREIIGKDPRPINEASVHCLVNDVIEVAEDGMSARSAYVTPGVIFSNINENEKRWCNFMWERYGSDYVFEDGNWLYLHEQVCPDIMAEFDDRNWANKAFCQELNPPEHMGPPHHRGGDGPGFDTSTELQAPARCTSTTAPPVRCRTRSRIRVPTKPWTMIIPTPSLLIQMKLDGWIKGAYHESH